MKATIRKRAFSLLLALIMACSLLPTAALAAEDEALDSETPVVCSELEGCTEDTHDEGCPLYVTPGEPDEVTDPAVAEVQALIDVLPAAEEITDDNAEEVAAQLDAIDEAKLALTDEQLGLLNFERYAAAVEALSALADQAGADQQELLAEDENTYSVTVTVGETGKLSEAVTAALPEDKTIADVTSLKVNTEDGVVLTPIDFQFLSGVVVSETANGRYSSVYAGSSSYNGDNINYLKNLTELDLSGAACEQNAIPPRAFQGNTKITKIILPNTLERTFIHAFSGMSSLAYLGTENGNLTFPDSMEIMGEGMVYQCSNLTGELSLPKNLKAIGSSCFYQSSVSGAITIPGNVNISVNTDINSGEYKPSGSAFSGTKISSLVFEDGITAIPDYFANGCTELTSVTIPSSVTEIGSYAFAKTKLTALPAMDAVEKIGSRAFSEIETFTSDIVLNGTIEIGARAFQKIKTSGNVTINSDVALSEYLFTEAEIGGNITISAKTIPTSMCNETKINSSLILKEGVQEIQASAFSSVTVGKDSSLTFPSTLKKIGQSAFKDAGFTGTLVLPSGLTEIGVSAFYNHKFTGNLSIPGGVETIGESAFMQSSVDDNTDTENLPGFDGTLTIGEGVKTIADRAFMGNGFTGSLTLPNSVETVEAAAFQLCGFNGTLTLSKNLATIGNSAFRKNQFSGNLIIPKTVTSIGKAAFSMAGAFDNVVLNGNVTLSQYSFANLKSGAIIYMTKKIENSDNYWTGGPAVVAVTNDGIFPEETTFEMGNLATPIRDDYKFDGWYLDDSFQEKVGDNTVTANKTYYAKWVESNTRDYTVTEKLEFGSVKYGESVEARTITATLSNQSEDTASIKSAVSSNSDVFTVGTINGNTVTVTPASGLSAGNYSETIYVTVGNDYCYFVPVTLTVTKADSTTIPGENSADIQATYGDTITLIAQVARAQAENGIMALSTANLNEVVFKYGDTVLGTSTVAYTDAACTTGTATLRYDTSNGGIPVSENGVYVNAEYGGSINLNGSNTNTIKVILSKAETTVGITASSASLSGGGTVTLTVDKSGLPDGAEVSVTCDNTIYNPTAGADGGYSVDLPNSNATYQFTVTYAGDTTHKAATSTCTVTVTRTGGSSGGSSSSGSSSNTTTETVTNKDGSRTTIVTNKTTGTVTETTKFKDGSTLVVETKKDGTVTTTETTVDKVVVKTVDEPGEDVTATVTIPRSIGTTTVTIPADVDYGMVAVDAKTGEVVKLSVPTEDGMLVKLDGSADLVLVDKSKDFTDTNNHWAEDAINFATAHGMFSGTSATTFSPDSTMTRGMIAVVLHNFDDNPDHAFTGIFHDVASDSWYADGIHWMVDSGIASGYGNGLFGANDSITREQLATFLYNFAKVKGFDVSGRADLSRFTDGASVSSYATETMSWAVDAGLFGGTNLGTLVPQANATRAQVATVLMRFVENLTK